MPDDPQDGEPTVGTPPSEMRAVEVERDDLARQVALARLKRRLFDHDVAVKLGRYHLLEVVGEGGMGVVWGAWDPELDRRVAIKLVKPSLAAARDRILVEGQALAKLSHPNVVPIYDVGVLDEQIYLVMEWVRGQSLRVYASTARSVRELVEVYRQAGEGLAAAHAAGLVHRDFKPDNAIRGDDGRVRVLDFGLARAEVGDAGSVAGTPRYMAPEQVAGEPVSAASDQYACCVALREALIHRNADGRAADVPSWLAAIFARGTHADPATRYASMSDLLQALGRDPARIRRRRAAGAIGVVALASAFVIGQCAKSCHEPERCTGADAELAGVWNTRARDAIARHLAALGPSAGQEAAAATRDLDGYGAAWTAAHRQACEAHERNELPATLYDRRLGCLARSRAALGAVAEVLASVPPAAVDTALVAARSLPDVRRCADLDAAQIAPPPERVARSVDAVSREVERARVLAVAAHPGAEPAASAAVRAAEATAYTPLIARALLVEGRAETAMEHDAASSLSRAVRLAIEGGDDATAVEAYARLVWASGGKDVDGLSLVEPMAVRAGPLGVFGRALLYNNLASARMMRGDRAGARELLLRARRELPADPTRVDLELVCIAQNLALLAATAAEREAELEKTAATIDRVLGPSHPMTLDARGALALTTEHGERARARMTSACEQYRRYRPHVAAAARCDFELGWLADEAGDLAGASAAMQRATADPPPADHKLSDIAAGYVAAVTTSPDDAQRAIAALHEFARTLSASSELEARIAAADAYVAAARGGERLGNRAGALASWRAALALLEPIDHPLFRRRLALTRAAVALHLAGTDPGESHRLAQLARDWYTAAGGYDDLLRELPR